MAPLLEASHASVLGASCSAAAGDGPAARLGWKALD